MREIDQSYEKSIRRRHTHSYYVFIKIFFVYHLHIISTIITTKSNISILTLYRPGYISIYLLKAMSHDKVLELVFVTSNNNNNVLIPSNND